MSTNTFWKPPHPGREGKDQPTSEEQAGPGDQGQPFPAGCKPGPDHQCPAACCPAALWKQHQVSPTVPDFFWKHAGGDR